MSEEKPGRTMQTAGFALLAIATRARFRINITNSNKHSILYSFTKQKGVPILASAGGYSPQ